MTMRLLDAAPDEAQVLEVSEQLNEALADADALKTSNPVLELDSSYLDAARTVLGALSEPSDPGGFHGSIPQTEKQVELFLDFDPSFLDIAKQMLKEFIERSQHLRA
jgi:hypothetical protein